MPDATTQAELYILQYLHLKKRKPTLITEKKKGCVGMVDMKSRRFLGNKYKLLSFIKKIVDSECKNYKSFCDIFAGTGVVGSKFNKKNIKVISNDLLNSNYMALEAFLGTKKIDTDKLKEKIFYLNNINATEDNYFSTNFANTYFTLKNARKIGLIRDQIDQIAENKTEKAILITSLLYAVDKVANTVGHYDAYRKNLDTLRDIELLLPSIHAEDNYKNTIFNEDANELIKKIECDILYIDPPYNSRQYCDSYHLLENLATWKKPEVFGVAKKMDRSHLKSKYCLKTAKEAFEELISLAKCKHILVSYNNTGESKDGRSNARITDEEILAILKNKGRVKVFKEKYKAFTAGKSHSPDHEERVFYCNVS